ncbi:MAG: CapA family protein [Lentisphaeria bacterium]|nr:CapA family protein [Lentisphaeria bacterium]
MFDITENQKIVFDEASLDGAKSIFITGDLIPRERSEERLCAGNIDGVFGNVLEHIQSCDAGITNLECAVTNGGEPIFKCGPNLKTRPETIPALVKAGFDIFALANNHSRDWGNDAFLETMKCITDAGAKYVGGGRDLKEASGALFFDVAGLRLAVFNSSMRQACDCTKDTPGSNPLNPPAMAAAITRVKDECDFLLVVIHDGKEYCPFPSQRVRENYRAFIDAGADAVIAHHPHVAQGFEEYNGKFIAYSLGNFHFYPRKANPPPYWRKSFSLKLFVNKHQVAAIEVVPHKINDDYCLELLEGEEKRSFLERISRLNSILEDDARCDHYFQSATLSCQNYMRFISLAVKQFEAGDYQDAEFKQNMFYFNHYLETMEHYDVILAQTLVNSRGRTLEAPADLDYFMTEQN